jgi:hypothetical protein
MMVPLERATRESKVTKEKRTKSRSLTAYPVPRWLRKVLTEMEGAFTGGI